MWGGAGHERRDQDHDTDHRRPQGLGYETARRPTEAGDTVLVGARDPQRGRAAAERIGAPDSPRSGRHRFDASPMQRPVMVKFRNGSVP